MRYTPDQKQRTAAKILAAAGSAFRQEGYGGAGVDGMAHEAGVTSGAFYKHFQSKAAAFEAAVDAGLKDVQSTIERAIADQPIEWLVTFVDYYFSSGHRENLACGCVLPGLTGEVARGTAQVGAVYQAGIERVVSIIETGLMHLDKSERRPCAWAMLAMLSGGVQIARAVHDEAQATEIAVAMRAAVLRIAKVPDFRHPEVGGQTTP